MTHSKQQEHNVANNPAKVAPDAMVNGARWHFVCTCLHVGRRVTATFFIATPHGIEPGHGAGSRRAHTPEVGPHQLRLQGTVVLRVRQNGAQQHVPAHLRQKRQGGPHGHKKPRRIVGTAPIVTDRVGRPQVHLLLNQAQAVGLLVVDDLCKAHHVLVLQARHNLHLRRGHRGEQGKTPR